MKMSRGLVSGSRFVRDVGVSGYSSVVTGVWLDVSFCTQMRFQKVFCIPVQSTTPMSFPDSVNTLLSACAPKLITSLFLPRPRPLTSLL